MPIERVLEHHCTILAGVERFEQLAAGPHPGASEGIRFRRWGFTRDLLLHFALMEGEVYGPMMDDARPEAARRASLGSAATVALMADFREHAGRWHVFPAPSQWETYCRSLAWLMARIRARIEAEATDIVPLLPPQSPTGGQTGPRESYVAEAWALRAMIFPGARPDADNDGVVEAA